MVFIYQRFQTLFDTLLPVSTLTPTHYESPRLTEEELNPHVSDSFA